MVSESLSSMDNAALRELIGDKRIKALIAEDVKAVQSRKPSAVPRDQNRQQGGQFAPKSRPVRPSTTPETCAGSGRCWTRSADLLS